MYRILKYEMVVAAYCRIRNSFLFFFVKTIIFCLIFFLIVQIMCVSKNVRIRIYEFGNSKSKVSICGRTTTWIKNLLYLRFIKQTNCAQNALRLQTTTNRLNAELFEQRKKCMWYYTIKFEWPRKSSISINSR